MITVAICDDELNIGAELECALSDIFTKLNISHEIDVFSTGSALCRNIEAGTHYDLIFLDIEFAKEKSNGVEIGRLVRDAQHNSAVSIVFISWEKKYSMQLFELRPLNFLAKPLEYEKIERTVETYLQISELFLEEFTYKKGHNTLKLQMRDIIYFESRERKIFIHLVDGRTEDFYGSLKKIYNEQLQKFDVLFIHAAYAVNYDYIATIKYNQLLLADHETSLPISPNRRREVRENYFTIMKKRRAGF